MMRHNQPEKLGLLGSDVWHLTQSNSYHTWLWETALYNNTCIASLYVKKPKRNSMLSLKFNSVLNLSGWWGFKSTVEIRWWLMFFFFVRPFFFFLIQLFTIIKLNVGRSTILTLILTPKNLFFLITHRHLSCVGRKRENVITNLFIGDLLSI